MHAYICAYTHTHQDTEIGRQTDRHTDRQTDGHAYTPASHAYTHTQGDDGDPLGMGDAAAHLTGFYSDSVDSDDDVAASSRKKKKEKSSRRKKKAEAESD